MFGRLSGLTFARGIGLQEESQMKRFVSSFVLSATLLGLGGGCLVEGRARVVGPPPPPPPRATVEVEVAAPPPPPAQVEVEVEEEPPPPRRVVVETRPGFIFIEGRWEHRHGRWVWRDGYWEREHRGYVWVPGRWERRGRHSVWIEGSWRRR